LPDYAPGCNGRGTNSNLGLILPCVFVKGKCQGLMFSDFVSLTPFKQLKQLFPRP